MLAATALVLAFQSRGAGGWAVAALLIAATVPPIVLSPLTGRLVDRVDSRILLTAVGLGQAACCALMAYSRSTAVLIALSALLAAGLAVTQPTFAALLPSMAGRAQLGRAVAIGQTATSVGMLVGPAAAGLLVGRYGLRVPLLLDGATYLAVVVAGLTLRTRRNAPAVPGAEPAAARETDWLLRRDRLLAAITVMISTAVGAVSLINVVEVFFVRGDLHASAGVYGLISSVWLTAMLVGAWLVAPRDAGDGALGMTMVGLIGTTCAVVAAASAVPTAGWLIALFALGGVANGGVNTVAGVLLGRRVPASARGRAQARVGAAVSAANMIGYVLGGALLGLFAPRALLAVAGIAGLTVVVAFAVPIWKAGRADVPAAASGPVLEAVA
jgi:MFS family permease